MTSEFRMVTDISKISETPLLFNYDELKSFLTEALQEYKTLVVTQDSIPDAKAKRAKLNKLSDNLDSYRISVKKQIMEQYDTDFAPKVNELKAMTKEASESISEQIKAFEKIEADAKIAEIKAEYDAFEDDEAKEYCTWLYVFNPKWANKGYKTEDAKEEVRAALFYTAADLESIRQFGVENTAYLLDIYKDTHDINAVILKSIELESAKEREARRKQEEAEKKAPVRPAIEPQYSSVSATTGGVEESNGFFDDVVTVDFRVTCTRSQLDELGKWMRQNGISYGRVPK